MIARKVVTHFNILSMKQLDISNGESKKLVFVIHKHKATQLHYDFRLQVGKSMPSWAITKGPTLDPKQRRLAKKVNDHTITYRNFEGVIPEGEYGAGPVMIWDEGTYIPQREQIDKTLESVEDFNSAQRVMRQGLKSGQIKFELFGTKVKGSFALVKVERFGQNSWLMVKHKDKYVKTDYDPNTEDFSARTKRSLTEILNSGFK